MNASSVPALRKPRIDGTETASHGSRIIVLTVVPQKMPTARGQGDEDLGGVGVERGATAVTMMTVTQNFSPWGILARNSRVDRRGEPDVRLQGPLAGQPGLVERRLDRRGLAEADVALLDLSVVLGRLLPRHPPDFFGAHDRADRQGRGIEGVAARHHRRRVQHGSTRPWCAASSIRSLTAPLPRNCISQRVSR